MQAVRLGHPVIELELVDSTSRYAWALLAERPSLPEGTVVMAHHQYAGRGQRGTTWRAEPGQNLTFSLVLRPTYLAAEQLFLLNKAFSLAVVEVIDAALPGLTVAVKWPNDIMIGSRKVCGLLIENHLSGSAVEVCVLGMGLNVNQSSFGAELSATATSLALESGYTHELRPIFLGLMQALDGWLRRLAQHRQPHTRAAIDQAYLARLYRYQAWADFRRVDAEGKRSEPFRGMIVGVTPEGRLAVQHDGQRVSYFAFKEVAFE